MADNAAAYRAQQAKDVANLIAAYAGANAPHRLEVYDKDTREKRPAKLRDVCILIRSRTGLGVLLRALDDNRGPNAADASNIPYRLAGGSLYFDTQEVQDLLNCLRAIDDPDGRSGGSGRPARAGPGLFRCRPAALAGCVRPVAVELPVPPAPGCGGG